MTDKEMLEAIAILEGTSYSETYDFPALGDRFDPPFNLDWVFEDLEIHDERSSLKRRRRRLLDWYFSLPSAKPKAAVELAAAAVGI